jgi:hypothetical protein
MNCFYYHLTEETQHRTALCEEADTENVNFEPLDVTVHKTKHSVLNSLCAIERTK